jgi:hypothetical protein
LREEVLDRPYNRTSRENYLRVLKGYGGFLRRFPDSPQAADARRCLAAYWREEVLDRPDDRTARQNYLRFRTPEQKEQDSTVKEFPMGCGGCVAILALLILLPTGLGIFIQWGFPPIQLENDPQMIAVLQSRRNMLLLGLVVLGLTVVCWLWWLLVSGPRLLAFRKRVQAELGPLPAEKCEFMSTLEVLRLEYLGEGDWSVPSSPSQPIAEQVLEEDFQDKAIAGGRTHTESSEVTASRNAAHCTTTTDDEDPARPSRRPGSSKVLVLGIMLAVVAVTAIGVCMWAFFQG